MLRRSDTLVIFFITRYLQTDQALSRLIQILKNFLHQGVEVIDNVLWQLRKTIM